jgi:acetoin utilization protein AcuB
VVRGEKLVGILSKIDLIKLYSLGLSPVYVNFWEHTAKKVKHIMRKAVVTVSPEDPVKYAADLIVEYRVRSLPVVEKDSKLVGILSIGDVLRAFMKIKEEFEKKGMGGEIQR